MNKYFTVNLFVPAILALVLYILLYLPIEFLVTEIWLITQKISPLASTGFLLILVTFFCFVDWSSLLKMRSFRLVLIVLIIIGSLSYFRYRRLKLAREYLPKIYKVTREEGFQAETVKIKGVNFFPVWKKGKVFLGDGEMVIKSWEEDLILAEQPVPNRFGQVELYVLRSDGVISNRVPFVVGDPDSLESF